MSLEDKLGLLTYKSDTQAHIHIVSPKPCIEICKDKPCTTACPLKGQIQTAAEEAVRRIPGVTEVAITVSASVPRGSVGLPGRQDIAGVKNMVAVYSCKGGVGKSTVSTNVACALAQMGARVGLLDADIYGPNIPLMMGANEQPTVVDNKIVPLERHRVKLISIGVLNTEGERPVIWRGPLVSRAVTQFVHGVAWGELDYLLIDLPPGTGDIQLTILQTVPLAGVAIVTTPQEVALLDSLKGVAMFRQLNAPILGVIENMGPFHCPHCGQVTDIFSTGGGRREAERLGLPFLGDIPLDPRIVRCGDTGTPFVVAFPDTSLAQTFQAIAQQLAARISVIHTPTTYAV
ncbi:MAG: P-loop NTPase [Elusimicrobia bacterium]|nr:P-loop NTPase [Elusimicrobiota bacterium]